MSNYLTEHGGTRSTPQSEPMSPDQVENPAGGYVFTLDPLDHVKRFLILGAEGGTFYVGEREFVRENLHAVAQSTMKDSAAVVDLIVDVSANGRAKSNDPALYALAYVTVNAPTDPERAYAFAALSKVARIGTHLFHFAEYREALGGGWGRGMRRAVGRWYNDRSLASLAMQLIKYRQRDGWSHRDMLRLAHPEPDSPARDMLFRFAATGEFSRYNDQPVTAEIGDAYGIVENFVAAQACESAPEVARLITNADLPREAVPTDLLKDTRVWEALLPGMKPEAMIRNLATMARNGTLIPLSVNEITVAQRLEDPEFIAGSRLHPLAVLNASAIYGAGGAPARYSFESSLSKGGPFPVSQPVVGALDKAFHSSFGNVEPAGKRFLLAYDVSGSMSSPLSGSVLSCRSAAGAMGMVTMRTEPATHSIAFASGQYGAGQARYYDSPRAVTALNISAQDTLGGIIGELERADWGGTDCALPMLYATEHKLSVDCFVIYTDNETWAGNVHPAQALAEYRRGSGIDAKLVVVGMTSTGFSIADPRDPGMLDVVGFDTATPNLISGFARGDL